MGLWVWSYFMGGNSGVEGKGLEKQLNLGDGSWGIHTAGSCSVQNPAWLVLLAWGDEHQGSGANGKWMLCQEHPHPSKTLESIFASLHLCSL